MKPLIQMSSTQPWARRWFSSSVATLAWVATGAALVACAMLGSQALAQQAKPQAAAGTAQTARAILAGGCFWCVESDFDKVPGVLSTTSGYIGGSTANPTYEQVVSKSTGHAEAVEIVFDPKQVSYEQLLAYFWRTIDPTTKDRQFCDAGTPYRTAIFAVDGAQLAAAKKSLDELEKTKPFKDPIVTQIVMAGPFYKAEEYHQDYYKKNPVRYKYYRTSCGRDARLEQLWGKKPG
jgi:peptide-methionine (S)-S-oxide reductase